MPECSRGPARQGCEMSEAGSPSSPETKPPQTADARCAEVLGSNPRMPARGRRNIVLLSDGTGNSAAKLNKTNVWRLYQALDLGGDDQIAFYDDGVGTSGFRPLRLLGGAFGWGLSRNVRHLYEFLCRHYREGDHIYIFGFSRGAFTARTLAGLIARCGVLDCSKAVPAGRGDRTVQLNTREGLKAGVKLAYRSYRRGYDQAPVATGSPAGCGTCFWRPSRRRRRSGATTVLPARRQVHRRLGHGRCRGPAGRRAVDDDRPHLLPAPLSRSGSLAAQVDRACHAIALDDERHTFHPVLWNEQGPAIPSASRRSGLPACIPTSAAAIPDDDLAFVSLQWMIGEAQYDPDRGDGLRFDRGQPARHRPPGAAARQDARTRGGASASTTATSRGMSRVCATTATTTSGSRCRRSTPRCSSASRRTPPATRRPACRRPTGWSTTEARCRSRPDHLRVRGPAPGRARAARARPGPRLLATGPLLPVRVDDGGAGVACPTTGRRSAVRSRRAGWRRGRSAGVLGWLPALLPGFLSASASWWTDAWTQSALWFLALAAIYGWLLWHSRGSTPTSTA